MKVSKRVSVGAKFAKQGEDIKDQDIIKINDGGQVVDGDFGEQHVFKVETRNGEKALSFNQTSMNNIIDVYGDETGAWVGKEVKIWVLRQNVSGKIRPVVYLTHPDATPEEPVPASLKKEAAPASDEPNPDDIPF